MTAVTQQLRKDIELRRVLQIHNKSNTLSITVPEKWVDLLGLEPKMYVKLELDENKKGFSVERLDFKE